MLSALDAYCLERQFVFYPKADLPYPRSRLPGLVPVDSANLEIIADLCQRTFGSRPASVASLIESGTFHYLYRARWTNGRNVVIRVNALSTTQCDFALEIDGAMTGVLRPAGLPALEVYEVDLSRRFCPFDYAILEEATGKSLSTLDDDDTALVPVLRELGRTIGRLHRINTDGFGLLDVQRLVARGLGSPQLRGLLPAWADYLFLRLDEHLGTCVGIGAMTVQDARSVDAMFRRSAGMLAEGAPSLLHGDLGNHNIFTDGTRITALIDWEDCLSGDPMFEVAFWASFHPERRHPAFLDGYRSIRSLPADFESRFWLYFLRISLAKTVLRHRLQIADRPGREPASARIQKALNILDTVMSRWHQAAKRALEL
jgi:Ser/Thr protein kinase RdoA (MazF antagonist)